jgi:hypothetical protein
LPYKPNELVARYVAGLLEPLGETMAGKWGDHLVIA